MILDLLPSQVARNIFEAGFKKFGSNPEFVDAYVDFLLGIGDAINVRTLYERALQVNPIPRICIPCPWPSSSLPISPLARCSSARRFADSHAMEGLLFQPALCNRSLQANTDVKVTKLLWDGFLKFEYRFGTLEAYQALEVLPHFPAASFPLLPCSSLDPTSCNYSVPPSPRPLPTLSSHGMLSTPIHSLLPWMG